MTDYQPSNVLPCPFCGHMDLGYQADGRGHCPHCKTIGPAGGLDAWNKRAQPEAVEGDTEQAIERLTVWLRDFGHKKPKAFTDDIGTVVEAAKQYLAMVKPDETEDRCECHERDSSYVCKYCYAQGRRGHMQR